MTSTIEDKPVKAFKVDAHYVEDMYTVIYMQFVNDEQCRLLEEQCSTTGGAPRFKASRVLNIHDTAKGGYYVMYRGRRLHLDQFLRVGGPWSALRSGHTVYYQ